MLTITLCSDILWSMRVHLSVNVHNHYPFHCLLVSESLKTLHQLMTYINIITFTAFEWSGLVQYLIQCAGLISYWSKRCAGPGTSGPPGTGAGLSREGHIIQVRWHICYCFALLKVRSELKINLFMSLILGINLSLLFHHAFGNTFVILFVFVDLLFHNSSWRGQASIYLSL